VAVNVTDWPEQIDVALADTVTAGVTVVFTVISTVLELAVAGLAHAALDVTTTDTASLLVNADDV